MAFSGSALPNCFELDETVDIPLLGVVAAGQPYAAFSVEDTLSVPTRMWGGKRVFALRVQGSSMIDEGIHHGDYLIVEPRETADNGQTVVAEVDGGVTVKKIFRQPDGQVRLQPANVNLLPLLVPAEQVRVVGVVVGILRKCGTAFGPLRPRPDQPAAEKVTRLPVRYRQSATHDDQPQIEINALDDQLERWAAAIDAASADPHSRGRVGMMRELQRDLTALRDWYARVTRPALRRALIAEANRVMRRMNSVWG